MGSVDQAQITGFLCRLCSKMHRVVIHIYGHEGIKHKLEQKINNYLPVTVTPTDLLPKTICKQCMSRVEQHHRLMETIQANHIKFQKLQNASAEVRRNMMTRRNHRPLAYPSTSNQATSTENLPENIGNEISNGQEDSSSTSSSNTDSIATSINTNDLSLTTNIDSTIHDDDSLIGSTNSD